MAFKFANRVKETTSTTGTGSVDLDGAATGYRAFSDELSDADETVYVIVDDPDNPTEYEVGLGTLTTGSPDSLSRDTVYDSSNGGSKINLQSGTTYTVVATIVAEALVVAPNIVGSIFAFAADSPPTGFLECDGALYSRTTYSRLFAKIGTTFGAGDGSTTFAVPDLRGEFIRGWDNGRGVDSGRTFGSTQSDQFESHRHLFAGGARIPVTTNSAVFQDAVDNVGTGATAFQGSVSLFKENMSLVGGSETRPRNVALMYAIKY